MERAKSFITFIFLFILLLPSPSFARMFGATYSTVLNGKEPTHLRGNQFMLVYDPECFKWRQFNIYFDGGFSHFWVTTTPYYSTLNIYSIAPVIRYTFHHSPWFHPFIDISIGLAYLSSTRLDDRNFGIHFAFQDRFGVGLYFGYTRQFSLAINALHYSNAHLSRYNSGVTAPLVLDIGYRFR